MDNRNILLDRALELFAARGYDAIGIQEVVQAAGVTKPTLYHYFNSKHGLLAALLEREFSGLIDELQVSSDYRGDLTLTLERIIRSYFGFAREHPLFYRMQLALYFAPPQSEPNQAVAVYNRQQLQMLESVFEKAVVQHGNMRGHARILAASFLGLINNFVAFYINDQAELNDPLVYRLQHQFMHGIFS
jgi:TetR/AcrR family transcriptional regulator